MLHQVGVGALGPVFRTYEPTRDRLVAVKVFRLDITPEQAQSLAHELSIAADAGLFHPSIVEPIASGTEGTVAYRAEEYVAAESLDVAMRHYAPAVIDKVLPFITQLAGAIDFARTAGIGHGALHPRDIFVTPEEARATGFGVVEALERVGLRAPVRRPYSAPERVNGAAWSTTADVFSLGVIAYELLTARRPAGTGAQIGALTGASLAKNESAVHAALARAMDDDPARRYPTALGFASALAAAARGEAPAVEQTSPIPVPAPLPVPPAYDDIADERDDDEAHFAQVLHQPKDAIVDPLDLDDEAVTPPERFADEFTASSGNGGRQDDLFGDQDDEAVAAPHISRSSQPSANRVSAGYGSILQEPETDPERRRSILPVAIVLVILGLAAGFAGGYALWGRGDATPDSTNTAVPVADPAAKPAEPGQPYSEQAVTRATPQQQPADAPSVPGDAPAPAAAAPAEPAPRPTATTGRIVVRSTPRGAGVTVDGRWRGRTPLTVEKLPMGSHDVRIVQPGYATARRSVPLSTGQPARTVSFTLRRTRPAAAPPAAASTRPDAPMTGSIYVDSRPRGARILLNGRTIGVTPLLVPDVRNGSHVVRLELEGHRPWSTSSTVVSGQQTRVTGSLEQIR